MASTNLDDARPPRPRWPWVLLALALIWVAVVRVPLVLNAETHLDSDLAVDGLTLIETMHGHWRWHYPGTPHIGTPAVGLSLPQAAVWGATPGTLVSGGVVAYELFTIATFLLAWRLFGPVAAAWSLVPLAFASVGTVWLSGRITGGHLLAATWYAASFALLASLIRKGGIGRSAFLGLWCGFGLYADQMVVFGLLGLIPAAVAGGFGPGRPFLRLVAALAFAAGLAIGYAPHWLGLRADDYDAYPVKFATIFGNEQTGQIHWAQTEAMAREHARLFALECLPRLVAGHRLPGFQADPRPQALGGRSRPGDPPDLHTVPITTTILSLGLFAASVVALTLLRGDGADVASDASRWGLLMASLAVAAGFVVNRNIYNSDNYRYLVFLLVPWTLGFGLLMRSLARIGGGGRAAAGLLAVALAGTMTLDTARWYQSFGWIDPVWRPVRQPLRDPALDWLREHPEVKRIYGSYWDVYRLAFLMGGRVRGVPYPEYPDRYYRELTETLPGHRPRVLIARSDRIGTFNRRLALSKNGTILAEGRGFWIIDWPQGEN